MKIALPLAKNLQTPPTKSALVPFGLTVEAAPAADTKDNVWI